MDSRWRIFYTTIIAIFRLSAVESILTFVVILPVIIAQILMFLDKNTSYSYLDEKDVVPNTTFDQIEVRKKWSWFWLKSP